LRDLGWFCYSSVPAALRQINWDSDADQGVDGKFETLDNLASLLLTNTTLRRYRKMQPFFKNKQSISVGVR
jgi:hypothetical protein